MLRGECASALRDELRTTQLLPLGAFLGQPLPEQREFLLAALAFAAKEPDLFLPPIRLAEREDDRDHA